MKTSRGFSFSVSGRGSISIFGLFSGYQRFTGLVLPAFEESGEGSRERPAGLGSREPSPRSVLASTLRATVAPSRVNSSSGFSPIRCLKIALRISRRSPRGSRPWAFKLQCSGPRCSRPCWCPRTGCRSWVSRRPSLNQRPYFQYSARSPACRPIRLIRPRMIALWKKRYSNRKRGRAGRPPSRHGAGPSTASNLGSRSGAT